MILNWFSLLSRFSYLMKRVLDKIRRFRQHQYFALLAAVGFLILALAAYLTILNRSYLVVILNRQDATIFVDGKKVEDIKTDGTKHIIRLFPGTHTVRVTAPNVLEYAETISLIRGLYKTVNPAFSLVPNITETATGDIRLLSAGPDPNSVMYLGDNGHILYQHNLKTNEKIALTSNVLSGISDIRWSSDFALALLKKPNGIYLYDFGRYDLLHQEEKFLLSAKNATLPAWDQAGKIETNSETSVKTNDLEPSKTNRRIAYFYQTNSEKSLVFANQLNENPERVADLSDFDHPEIIWSNDGHYIAVYGQEGIAIFDVFTRLITRASVNKRVSGARFSPNGNLLAYLSNNNLEILNISTNQIKKNGLETSIEKILWNKDSNFLTIAVPNKNNSDKFIKIDARTGEMVNYVYNSAEKIYVSRMILSADESTIIFQSSNKLFTLFLQSEE